MLVFLLTILGTFKSEDLKKRVLGAPKILQLREKCKGIITVSIYLFVLKCCPECLMTWQDAGSLQRIVHSLNKRPAKCLTGRSHFASNPSDVINPDATAKARNTDLSLFFVPVHRGTAWKESQAVMPGNTATEQRHSLSIPTFAGLSWQFFSVFLAKELEDPSPQPRLRGTRACHRAKEYKKYEFHLK